MLTGHGTPRWATASYRGQTLGEPLDYPNGLHWIAVIESIMLGDDGPGHQRRRAVLIGAGADLHLADCRGRTSLALARAGYAPVAQQPLAAGAGRRCGRRLAHNRATSPESPCSAINRFPPACPRGTSSLRCACSGCQACRMSDEHWMRMALAEAHAAAAAGEVPVGAVIVKDGTLVASGRNTPVALCDPSAHAELNALRAAAAALGNYRLDGCELFVTLEPCAMCVGAMLHARLARLVFGAADPKTGAAGSVIDLFAEPRLNHRTKVRRGVLSEECGAVLQDFFRTRRSLARELAEPLRDDALRTPASRFDMLPDAPWAGHYIGNLPSLRGWRMHYIDEGPADARACCVCLHGPGRWSYVWRHLIARLLESGVPRVLAPDLIGFGKSDKPKREAAHRLEWQRDVLLEWIERLDLHRIVLVLHRDALEPGSSLIEAAPERFLGMLVAELSSEPSSEAAWRAPFPDSGFEAALRAWGASKPSDLPPGQARALARVAMGYFAP